MARTLKRSSPKSKTKTGVVQELLTLKNELDDAERVLSERRGALQTVMQTMTKKYEVKTLVQLKRKLAVERRKLETETAKAEKMMSEFLAKWKPVDEASAIHSDDEDDYDEDDYDEDDGIPF